MLSVDFTMTATIRPEIINKTLNSFAKNFIDYDIKTKSTLFVNLDPIPYENMGKIEDTLRVFKSYFKDVVYNVPESANFTKSVNWVWSNVNTDIIFHLEDDWELISKISFENIINNYMKDDINQVILRAYEYKYRKMALSPSFIRKIWYKKFVGKFNFNKNPELQLRKDFIKQKNISVYGKSPVVRDIGREWIDNTKYKKSNKKEKFIKWEKK